MNIAESNKLIAEFMGNNEVYANIQFCYELDEELPTSNNICTIDNIEDEVRLEIEEGVINSVDVMITIPSYKDSWEMLMPVVKKIFEYQDENEDSELALIVRDALCDVSIKGVYDAVIEFIQWYNETVKSK